ncbi:MAG TPA: hypothetical protein VK846_10585 [Candidatus Limnocylindria bacterium]|nr:hypothetical protein [Candidatus Limnocylindria bacterium]
MKTLFVTTLNASHTIAIVQSQHASTITTYRAHSRARSAVRDPNTHHLLNPK